MALAIGIYFISLGVFMLVVQDNSNGGNDEHAEHHFWLWNRKDHLWIWNRDSVEEFVSDVLRANTWNDYSESSEMPFVCEVSNVDVCPDESWVGPIEKSCYAAFPMPKNFRNASESCVLIGAHLATIHSEEQYLLVGRLRCHWCWIGLVKNPDTGVWSWEDGSEITFSAWSLGIRDIFGGKANKGMIAVFNIPWYPSFGPYWNIADFENYLFHMYRS